MGRFNKGLFFGGLMGAGLTLMMTTKKGREVRDQLLDQAAELYQKVKQDIEASGQLEKLTKQKYVKKVTETVQAFIDEKGLPEETKGMLVKLITTQWTNLKKELRIK